MKYEPNNIYCVDAYKAIKEIPDKTIDLLVTDPPYEIRHTEGGGMLIEKGIKPMFDSLVEDNLQIGINDEIMAEWCRVMKKINIYIWCNKTLIPKLMDYFVNQRKCMFDIIIWHKINAMPMCGSKYLTDCEYCLYFHEPLHLNTVYDTAHTVYNLPINVKDKKLYNHPTIKPLDIIKNIISNSSNENDLVLDTFIGSGTTAVACKELGRNYIGFEYSPEYYQIACDRVNGITVQDRKAKENGIQNLFDMLGEE